MQSPIYRYVAAGSATFQKAAKSRFAEYVGKAGSVAEIGLQAGVEAAKAAGYSSVTHSSGEKILTFAGRYQPETLGSLKATALAFIKTPAARGIVGLVVVGGIALAAYSSNSRKNSGMTSE